MVRKSSFALASDSRFPAQFSLAVIKELAQLPALVFSNPCMES